MRFHTGFVLLAVMPFSSHGQERIPPTHWQEYEYPRDGFAMTFPYEPNPHADKVNVGLTVYTIRLSQTVALSVRTKSAPNCPSELATAIKQLQGVTVRTVTVVGHEAYGIEKSKEGSRSYERFWCGDKKLFVGSLRWPADQPEPPAAFRILDSFRLIRSAP